MVEIKQSIYFDRLKTELDPPLYEKLIEIPQELRSCALVPLLQLQRFSKSCAVSEYLVGVCRNESEYKARLLILQKEVSRLFTCCAYEWFSLIPIFTHEASRYVLPLYRAILGESIDNGQIQATFGWENFYIRMCLTFWACSPEPVCSQEKDARDDTLSVIDPAIVLRLHHPMSSYHGAYQQICPSPTYNENNKYQRLNRLPMFVKCPYCKGGEPCQASQNQDINGKCSPDDRPYRCNVDCGIHLCSTHGLKYVGYKNGDDFNKENKLEMRLRLNDGRKIFFIGWFRSKSKNDPMVKPGVVSEKEERNLNFGKCLFSFKRNYSVLELLYAKQTDLILSRNKDGTKLRERKIADDFYCWV